MENSNDLTPFEGEKIRKLWHEEQWYFSVVDVIQALTDSEKPSQYWHNMKKRDTDLSPICLKLKLKGQDGKTYPSDCANTEGQQNYEKETGLKVVSKDNYLGLKGGDNKELPSDEKG
jgi:hypothetical protein